MAFKEKIRDAVSRAFSASKNSHQRIKKAMGIFNNEVHDGIALDGYTSMTQKSLDPQIKLGGHRMLPALIEALPEVQIVARNDGDIQDIEDLAEINKIMEDADSEFERMKTALTQGIATGNTLSMTTYDPRTNIVRSPILDMTCFAPDPDCSEPDLSDAEFVVYRTYQSYDRVRMKYGKRYAKKGEKWHYKVDRIWMRKEWAQSVAGASLLKAEKDGIDITKDIHECVLIENEPVSLTGRRKVIPSPNWYPDFPFSMCRNYVELKNKGKASDFWGSGWAESMYPQQQLNDQLLSWLIFFARNNAVGRWLSEQGALDESQILNMIGGVIELNENFKLDTVLSLPPIEASQTLFNAYQMNKNNLTEQQPSLNPVFAGDAPGANMSGKAITSLQGSSYHQLTAFIKSFNEFRKRRTRIRLNFIQQYLQPSLAPNSWRRGTDTGMIISKDLRNVHFLLKVMDVSSLPQTPAGKIEVLNALAAQGIYMKPERLVDFLNISKGYGLTLDDFIMPQAQGLGGEAVTNFENLVNPNKETQ